MKVTIKQLRKLIRETVDLRAWQSWLIEFENAYQNEGYDVKSDMPPYDFVSSEGPAAEQIDRGILKMFEAGLSPQDAVEQMMDRDGFWRQWVGEKPLR